MKAGWAAGVVVAAAGVVSATSKPLVYDIDLNECPECIEHEWEVSKPAQPGTRATCPECL